MDEGALFVGFDTLGLSEHDGTLRLVGLDHQRRIPAWERYVPLRVRGYEGDGETWSPGAWSVDDEDVVNFIDPQFLGDVLYFTSRSGVTGDPANNPTEIRSSPPPRVWLSGMGFADPSAVEFQGEHHLFVTARGNVELYVGDPPVKERTFEGFAVPYALVVDDELWLVAQGPAGDRVPYLARLVDGTWSDFQRILSEGAIRTCTSPVLHLDEAGGALLICVEEVLWEGPGRVPGETPPGPLPGEPQQPGPPG